MEAAAAEQEEQQEKQEREVVASDDDGDNGPEEVEADDVPMLSSQDMRLSRCVHVCVWWVGGLVRWGRQSGEGEGGWVQGICACVKVTPVPVQQPAPPLIPQLRFA